MTNPAPPEHNPAVLAARFARALAAEAAAVTPADIAARRAPTAGSPPRPVSVLVLGFLERARPAPSWRRGANCAGVDPELFYPQRGGSKVLQAEQIRQAKAVCDGCAVRAQCLTEALERQEPWGIWGGLSERERRRLQTRLPRVARCSRCGGRYVKRTAGQKFCGDECPSLTVRVRARAAS